MIVISNISPTMQTSLLWRPNDLMTVTNERAVGKRAMMIMRNNVPVITTKRRYSVML